MRTVPVQIICRKCANPYRTTVRGGNTRCPHCRTSRHVRIDQEWEGPVPPDLAGAAARSDEIASRPPVWVECRCGHEWQSRARDRMTIRCPECGTGQRVPYRTHENTGPTPARRRPAPAPRPVRTRPEPPWRPVQAPADPWEDERPETPPRRPADALAGFLAALQGRTRPVPAPAAPRPAAPAVAPRPAPAPRRPSAPAPTAVAPIDVSTLPLREQNRRDRMSQVLRSLSAPLMVWYDAPPGLCEVLDQTLPRDQQRCPRTMTHGVTFFQGNGDDVTAYACTEHTGPLAATALRSPYIRASPYRIR